jgi:hypothetical protein
VRDERLVSRLVPYLDSECSSDVLVLVVSASEKREENLAREYRNNTPKTF